MYSYEERQILARYVYWQGVDGYWRAAHPWGPTLALCLCSTREACEYNMLAAAGRR